MSDDFYNVDRESDRVIVVDIMFVFGERLLPSSLSEHERAKRGHEKRLALNRFCYALPLKTSSRDLMSEDWN